MRRVLVVLFVIAIGVAAAAATVYFRPDILNQPQTAAIASPSPPAGVACLGRIQPEDGAVTIGARSLSGQPSMVGQLRVKEGDDIKAGQIVAILNSANQLAAAWSQADSQIKVAEMRRNQVMAGAKTADIAAQETEIKRLEIELANARSENARMDNLFKQGIISQAALDQSRLPVDTKPQLIAQARERLRGLTEVRQIDIDVANAELQAAIANAARAKAEAEAATVHSPYSGRVVKIHAWEGEEVGPSGILELARVERMYVIAEVAENDIPRVKVGQNARITGESLPAPLEGKVVTLGFKVSRNSMTQHDPVGLTDARIVEVKILLDNGSSVRNLIDAVVEVRILADRS